MNHKVIRYRASPERIQENQGLIEGVFFELHAKAPEGIRYLSLNLGNGAFMHVVETAGGASPLPDFEAFQLFQRGLKERCVELPQVSEAVIVGNYRAFGE